MTILQHIGLFLVAFMTYVALMNFTKRDFETAQWFVSPALFALGLTLLF